MQVARIETTQGAFTSWFSERGLARLEFPADGQSLARNTRGLSSASAHVRRWHKLAAAALRRALSGKPPTKLPPLDLSVGTEFQQRVWSVLQRIPLGKTQTYSQVATAIGKPEAVRAAGRACGANPIAILVPCHRVVPKSGGLGGFSSGPEWKRRLLTQEGVALERSITH
jgi:AraC family transcriptional regulator of adaptative response/methylated-DNA-[protein]-cysteine methyltransferase